MSIPKSTELFFYTIVFSIIVITCVSIVVAAKREKMSAKQVTLWGIGTLLGYIGWLGLTGWLAKIGLLQDFSLPPKFFILVLVGVILTIALAFSRFGTILIHNIGPIGIITYQVFRIPVELFLHQAYKANSLPVQLTYEGWNYDIITGITAPLVALWIWKNGFSKPLILSWNIIGLALLINVVGTAILSIPTPFQVFSLGESGIFLAVHYPYIWLPMVLVTAALFGHMLIFRWYSLNKRSAVSE